MAISPTKMSDKPSKLTDTPLPMAEATPVLDTKLNRTEQLIMAFVIAAPLIVTLYAAVKLTQGTVHWGYPAAAVVGFILGGIGVTAGYHRMLTHQAFDAHPAVQYTLLILGAIAGMASPVTWAQKHIHHHSHSDTEEDIHSPHIPIKRGGVMKRFLQLFDAHMGWMFRHQPIRVSKKALQVTSTPAAQFVHKTWLFWMLGAVAAPLAFGWNAFIWVGVVRLFLNHHITWSVNSICHVWGKQPFQNTRDHSKNNALVGVLALGEGWHNNHHFRPTSARHGLLPGQFDLTYSVIRLLERMKLVWNVQRYAPCSVCSDWYAVGNDRNATCAKCQKSA